MRRGARGRAARTIAGACCALAIACVPTRRGHGVEQAGRELPLGVEAISLLGDSLRRLPLADDTRQRYERQLAAARAAWERHPENSDSLVWYGRRLGYLGRFRDAIDVFSRGLEQHPNDPWMLRHLGHRYISVRAFDSAVADLERAARRTAGQVDIVEPDGQPNESNIPIGTLHSNIRYHLGLAYYLLGRWDDALRVYRAELAGPVNDDRRVSVTHWAYLALCRQGRSADAAALLRPVRRDMRVIENHAYHRLALLYKGELPVDSLLAGGRVGAAVTDVSTAYGVATWLRCHDRRAEASRLYRDILATGQWGAFGYIAAEAELKRESVRAAAKGEQ